MSHMSMSEADSMSHYAALLSCPPLIARTGTTPWDRKPDKLGPARSHALCMVWEEEDGLSDKICSLLESSKVKYTSVDIVRVGPAEAFSNPVILWISVTPGTLSRDDGLVAANKCKELLGEYDVTDVDVEIRESVPTEVGHNYIRLGLRPKCQPLLTDCRALSLDLYTGHALNWGNRRARIRNILK